MVEELSIMEISSRERKMVKVASNGKMDLSMKETLLMGNSKDLENTTSLILTRHIWVNSEWATWKEEELKVGPTAENMMENSKTVKKTEKEPLSGQTEIDILVAG
jgi:hypothetical protein